MYPWLHQQAIQEGFHNLTDTDDATSCKYMSLTRSTFAGGQRFCSYLWSGDTDSRFDVLLQQITVGTSVAASGISSWTLDIGGFNGLNVDTDTVSLFACHQLRTYPDFVFYRVGCYLLDGLLWASSFRM